MPIKPDAPFPKTSGDNLRSKDWNDAITELIRLDNDKANRSGDKFSGPLSVAALGVASDAPPSGIKVKSLTRIDEGATGTGAWANFGSNAYFSDNSWQQVDLAKAGVNLHINADGGGQEFRFMRTEANGANLRNIATIGTMGMTLEAGSLTFGMWNGSPSPTIWTTGRMHITGGELCYLLHNSGVIVGKEWGGNGNLTVEGAVFLSNSDIYFNKTDHDHSGYGNTPGFAAIENARNFDALMILGRAGTDKGRKVKLWDYLEVNGDMKVTGNLGTHGFDPKPKQDKWGGGIHTWDVEAEGTVWSHGPVQTGNRDLAENYASDVPLEQGDVVCIDQEHGRILPCAVPNDEFVMGIISSQPGLLLNAFSPFEAPPTDNKLFPVALSGCVPCKVTDENGPIRRGDLLTSSSMPGHAMKATPITIEGHKFYRPGTIIGKALDPLHEKIGLIEVFVTLR